MVVPVEGVLTSVENVMRLVLALVTTDGAEQATRSLLGQQTVLPVSEVVLHAVHLTFLSALVAPRAKSAQEEYVLSATRTVLLAQAI